MTRHPTLLLVKDAVGAYRIPQARVNELLAHDHLPDLALPHKTDPSTPRVIVPLRECAGNARRPATYELPRGYAGMLYTRGLAPILLPPVPGVGTDHPIVARALERASGALYIGGQDIDPRWYGAQAHQQTVAVETQRDGLEIGLLHRHILPQRLPFFGICRGTQVLNVAFGGSLHQHLPDLYPDEEHGESPVAPGEDARHTVYLDPASRTARLVEQTVILVNSHHHQAVDRVGFGLRVAGRSKAGVIEIVEGINTQHWCFGVQGHPERGRIADLEPLIDSFADAVKDRRNR